MRRPAPGADPDLARRGQDEVGGVGAFLDLEPRDPQREVDRRAGREPYTGVADDREFLIGAGQLGCFDLAQPSAGMSSPSNSLAITLGRLSIDRLVRNDPDMHGRVFSSPAGMLLVDYILTVERHLPSLDQNDVPAIARAVLAQFAAIIELTTRSNLRLSAAGVQHKARQHIERHLVRGC